jgi:hypothetical protein
MIQSSSLAQLLRETLDKVTPPEGYAALRDRLVQIRPTGAPPTIRESPENTRDIPR